MDPVARKRLERSGVQSLPTPERLKFLSERLASVKCPPELSQEEFDKKVFLIKDAIQTLSPEYWDRFEFNPDETIEDQVDQIEEIKFRAATRLALNQDLLFQSNQNMSGPIKKDILKRILAYPFGCYYISEKHEEKTWQRILSWSIYLACYLACAILISNGFGLHIMIIQIGLLVVLMVAAEVAENAYQLRLRNGQPGILYFSAGMLYLYYALLLDCGDNHFDGIILRRNAL